MRVVVEFAGGLGNQLFQLSAGLHAARFLGAGAIEADVRSYGDDSRRTFDLDGWPTDPPLGRPLGRIPPRSTGIASALRRRTGQWLPRGFQIAQDIVGPPVLNPGRDVYLRGYWQDRHLAEEAVPQLRAALRALSQSDFSGASPTRGSIAVHVRRGDYVADPSAAAKHGAQSLDYYLAGISLLRERLIDAPVVIFTDDPAWVESNLLPRVGQASLLRGGSATVELQLMSEAAAHVISNSSFSWWAAVISSSACRIAPARWFADGRPEPNLFDSTWVRL
jgi:hypothetical protein